MIWILLYILIAINVGIFSYYESKKEYPKVDVFINFLASQIIGIVWPFFVIVRLVNKL